MNSPNENRRFGRYEIEGELGSGGMSIVYRAYDPKMKRTVALKLLLPALALSEKQRARFFNEAYMAADLYHENVCTIFEADEVDGTPYIAMAFVKGQEVSDLIAERNLGVTEALEIVAQCCRGLRALHGIGVVHRDIKPSNIMVDHEGRVRIMDFGIAKQQGPGDPESRIDLTRPGTTLGTVAYMSPEQARGEDIDDRSDLWSLGVVLYEMLSGERPFPSSTYEGTTTEAIINSDPVPIANFRKDLPKSVSAIIDRTLQKDADKRYRSAAEMLTDIEAAMETAHVAPVIGTRRFDYVLVGSSVVFVGLLATFIYTLLTWPAQGQADVCPAYSGETSTQEDFYRGDTLLVRSSPPNATVSIDGDPVGKTDQIGVLQLVRPSLAGSRSISVCAPGYETDTRTVDLRRGRVNEHEAALSLPPVNSPWSNTLVVGLMIGALVTCLIATLRLVRRRKMPLEAIGVRPERSTPKPSRRTVPPTLPDTRTKDAAGDKSERIGSYTLGRKTGEGSHTVLFEARSAEDRPFAVCTLRDEFLTNEEMVDAFRRSMETLEAVQRANPSPTLLSVYELGAESGRPYAVLEHLRGPTLREVLEEKGPFNVNAALEITRQVCYGLRAIHDSGHVHGSVSLNHIIALEANSVRRVKLVGLGDHELERLAPSKAPAGLARPLIYTAPEVATGAGPTTGSDIYSTGIVVYTLLQGSPPFAADDDRELIRQHAKADLQPMNPRVPPLVQRMVADMLQKNPEHRSIDADAIIKRIETTLDTTVTLLDTANR